MNQQELVEILKKHEGVVLKPYKDSVGKLTIGIGRNLDDVGISLDEAVYLCGNDVKKSIGDAQSIFSNFDSFSESRQIAIVDMLFNLGKGGFLGFVNTVKAMKDGDWVSASQHMLQSKWARQVGNRAIEDSEMIKNG